MALPSTLANLAPPTEATLIRRIEDLERQQRETLPALMSAIAPMFADINQAIADIAAQQATLADLVSKQVATDAQFANGPGTMNITTSEVDIASVSFTVPAGYTRAQVLGISSIGVFNGATAARSFAGRIYIDRNGTPVNWGGRWYQAAPASSDSGVYPNVQRQLTGLAAGDVLRVRLIVIGSTAWGATSGGSTLDAQVTYTR